MQPVKSIAHATRSLRLALGALLVTAASCRTGPVPASTATATASRASAVYPGAEWARVSSPEAAGWSRAGLDSVRALLAQGASHRLHGGRRRARAHGVRRPRHASATSRRCGRASSSMLYGNHVASGKVRLDPTLARARHRRHRWAHGRGEGGDDARPAHRALRASSTRRRTRATTSRQRAAARLGQRTAPTSSTATGTSTPPARRSSGRRGATSTTRSRPTSRARSACRTCVARAAEDGRHHAVAAYRAYHMHLSTRDMARVGLLMLREGNWAGDAGRAARLGARDRRARSRRWAR